MGARGLTRLRTALSRLRQLRAEALGNAELPAAKGLQAGGGAASLAVAWREIMAGLDGIEAAMVAEQPDLAVRNALRPLLLPPLGGAVTSFVRRVRPLPMAARVELQGVLAECVVQLSATNEPNWSLARGIPALLNSFWCEPTDELLAVLEPTPPIEQLMAEVVEAWSGDEVPDRSDSFVEGDVFSDGTLAPLAGRTIGSLVEEWRVHRDGGALARACEEWHYFKPVGANYYLGAYLQASLEELLTGYEWPLCSHVCEHLQDPGLDYRWLPLMSGAKKLVIQEVLLRVDQEAPGAFVYDADRTWFRKMVARVWT